MPVTQSDLNKRQLELWCDQMTFLGLLEIYEEIDIRSSRFKLKEVCAQEGSEKGKC